MASLQVVHNKRLMHLDAPGVHAFRLKADKDGGRYSSLLGVRYVTGELNSQHVPMTQATHPHELYCYHPESIVYIVKLSVSDLLPGSSVLLMALTEEQFTTNKQKNVVDVPT
ncbi:hypothetical protein J6590_104470 [Homalodisca vitripennis]|nr:hypothetical protein J6590_104470 [Homalodisca vitripennis]